VPAPAASGVPGGERGLPSGGHGAPGGGRGLASGGGGAPGGGRGAPDGGERGAPDGGERGLPGGGHGVPGGGLGLPGGGGGGGGGGGRTILHVDMDAFFVAVELRRRPELVGLPVVVGGAGERGVVAAASYEARRYGVHSAMPSVRARRLCPDAVFLRGDYPAYQEASEGVFAIFRSFTPLVEGLSLDEAFLDVTGARRLFGDGVAIANLVRGRIRDELRLACSVGVAPTKFLAKLASEAAKPRASAKGISPGPGVVEIRPGEELAFLHPLPVKALWGVGPATFERLSRLGVTTVADLAALPEAALVSALGRANGRHLHQLAQGIDEREVEPDRDVKSIGHEQTFAHDLVDRDDCEREVVRMADAVAARLRHHGRAGRTVTLKVRFGTFTTITRSSTVAEGLDTGPAIAAVARALLDTVDPAAGVRLLGVSVSGLGARAGEQLRLGDDPGWGSATDAVDQVRERFGSDAIGPASLVGPDGIKLTRRGRQQWGPDED
jgi:DNA polymerase IV